MEKKNSCHTPKIKSSRFDLSLVHSSHPHQHDEWLLRPKHVGDILTKQSTIFSWRLSVEMKVSVKPIFQISCYGIAIELHHICLSSLKLHIMANIKSNIVKIFFFLSCQFFSPLMYRLWDRGLFHSFDKVWDWGYRVVLVISDMSTKHQHTSVKTLRVRLPPSYKSLLGVFCTVSQIQFKIHVYTDCRL